MFSDKVKSITHVCVFLYLLHAEYQNAHSTSMVKKWVLSLGLKLGLDQGQGVS